MIWVTNPLANRLFLPFAALLLALLGCAAAILLIVQYVRQALAGDIVQTSGVVQHLLWQRYRTWAVIGILFAAAVFCGPLVMAALCTFLCWQGTREYALLTDLPMGYQIALLSGGLLTCAAVLIAGPVVLGYAPVLAFFVWSLLTLYWTERGGEAAWHFTNGLNGLWGYLYLGWLPTYMLALSSGKLPILTLVVGLGVALSDVGAFCAGKALGGPKLAPRLSPNKTWGGVLGNVLGAALVVPLTSFVWPHLQLWQMGELALTIAGGCVWGDLLESLLKRQRGVKDAGALLPGFGGLLDRIDSLLIVAPLVYYLSLWLCS
jgi:phosphatidate cytidylyltransferase